MEWTRSSCSNAPTPRCIAQNAPAALAATKALIHRASITPIEAQLDAERDGIIGCMHTDEFRAAVKKFTSKNK